MDFNLKEEQLQLADAVRRWIGKDYGVEARRAVVASAAGHSAAAWATMAELGLLALPLPEQYGGFAGGALDLHLVMQELGRGLLVEPYLATVLGASCLMLAGPEAGERFGALLERVGAGQARLACAFGERQSRHDMRDIATRATRADFDGGGWVLDGEKKVVLHGAAADVLVVSARTRGGQRDEDGITLFAVPAAAPGVRITGYRMLDGQRGADVVLDNVRADAAMLVGREHAGWELLDEVLDRGAGLLCAEAVGAMDALFAATLDYLKTRQQFGVPIGKFQALQHRMADMYVHLEQARSMALLAAVRIDGADTHERRSAVSAAKYRVGQAARFIGQQAVQLHGGMGVTDELPAAHWFKRLSTIELALGDCDHHLARFIAQPGFAPQLDGEAA
jgi:alkylation response protein AidB-like acyl-CoA dehydrogenase